MNMHSKKLLALLALPAVLAACGKGNKAGVDCPDISGEWTTADGSVRSTSKITQNGCESVTGAVLTEGEVTLSSKETEIDGVKARAEFSKDKIELIMVQRLGDENGQTITVRGTITKPSNDELNMAISYEGSPEMKALIEKSGGARTIRMIRKTEAAAPQAIQPEVTPDTTQVAPADAPKTEPAVEIKPETVEVQVETPVVTEEPTSGGEDVEAAAAQEKAEKAKKWNEFTTKLNNAVQSFLNKR